MSGRTLFVRNLLGNLRLSAIICAVGLVAVAVYGLIADEPIAWELVVFLVIGMLLSSLVNAWIDVKREQNESGGGQ
jgi:membrane protein implicated in regulation of membrane protease activity